MKTIIDIILLLTLIVFGRSIATTACEKVQKASLEKVAIGMSSVSNFSSKLR